MICVPDLVPDCDLWTPCEGDKSILLGLHKTDIFMSALRLILACIAYQRKFTSHDKIFSNNLWV